MALAAPVAAARFAIGDVLGDDGALCLFLSAFGCFIALLLPFGIAAVEVGVVLAVVHLGEFIC